MGVSMHSNTMKARKKEREVDEIGEKIKQKLESERIEREICMDLKKDIYTYSYAHSVFSSESTL